MKKPTFNLTRAIQWIFLTTLMGGVMVWPSVATPVPDDDRPPDTQGRSAGSRGCDIGLADRGEPADMPAIIFLSSAGRPATVSTRPRFVWFSRDSQTNVENAFRLYQFDSASQTYQLLAEIQNQQMAAGILVMPFPETLGDLTVGQRYLWQVELVCDPDRPSGNLFAEAEFEVIAAPNSLSQAMGTATTEVEQASVYAAEDFWYEAAAMALTLAPTGNLRQQLFDRAALDNREQQKFENSPILLINPNSADSIIP